LWNKVNLSELPGHNIYFYSCKEIFFLTCNRHCEKSLFSNKNCSTKENSSFPSIYSQHISRTSVLLRCKVHVILCCSNNGTFLRIRCCNYSSRSLEPISRGMFICTGTYFIVANTNKTKYNNLRLKFVSEFKCYMEFRLRPFSSLLTQLSVGFNVVCRLHSITKLDA